MDLEKFTEEFGTHLELISTDLKTLYGLSPEDRKWVLKKALDKLIDVPGLPTFLEPLFFSLMVEWFDSYLKSKLETT